MLTQGFNATSSQGGIHSVLKGRLDGQIVILHRILEFLRNIMCSRKLTVARKKGTIAKHILSNLLEDGVRKDSSKFCECIRVHFTGSAQQLILEEFDQGFGYTVEPLLTERDVKSYFEGIASRGSSIERFALIVSCTFQSNEESVLMRERICQESDFEALSNSCSTSSTSSYLNPLSSSTTLSNEVNPLSLSSSSLSSSSSYLNSNLLSPTSDKTLSQLASSSLSSPPSINSIHSSLSSSSSSTYSNTSVPTFSSSSSSSSSLTGLFSTDPSLSASSDPSVSSSILFFKVTLRTFKGTVDIVAVYPNGSITCTHPGYANYSLPSKNIMAPFITGDIPINVVMHFHPMCLLNFVKLLPMEDILKLSVVTDRDSKVSISNRNDASWDFARRETENLWNQVGHARAKNEAVIRSTTNEIRNHPDYDAKPTRKDLIWLRTNMKYDSNVRLKFFEFTESARREQAVGALNTAAAQRKNCGLRSVEPPIVAAKPSLVFAKSVVTGSKKENLLTPTLNLHLELNQIHLVQKKQKNNDSN